LIERVGEVGVKNDLFYKLFSFVFHWEELWFVSKKVSRVIFILPIGAEGLPNTIGSINFTDTYPLP